MLGAVDRIEAVDQWRILALRVDFSPEEPDQASTTGLGSFDLRAADRTGDEYLYPYDLPPHDRVYFQAHLEALARYYRVVSEGEIEIESEVFPLGRERAYTLPRPMLEYGNGRSRDEIDTKWVQLVGDAVALAEADAQGPVFAEYNSLLIFHAGVGHETGEINDIRSVYLSPRDLDRILSEPLLADEGQHQIRDVWILPETVSQRGQAGLNGLLAKFFGHQLGLPGLSNFADGLPALGGWSLMDIGANRLGHVLSAGQLEPLFGFVPPHPMAWSKIELGWIEPLEVVRDTTVSLVASDRSTDLPKAIKIPIAPNEYFLVENRQRRGRTDVPAGVEIPFGAEEATFLPVEEIDLANGVFLGVEEYDAFVPGSGILIWHIDEGVIEAKRAEDAINNDPVAAGIALEEADGYRDIGQPTFERISEIEGAQTDLFSVEGVSRFGGDTRPDSRTNAGLASGVALEVLSALGDTMRLGISFGRNAANWPQTAAGGQMLRGADLDGDGDVELIADGDGGLEVFAGETGERIWRLDGARFLAAAPVFGGDGAVIFASNAGEVGAWRLGTTAPLWTLVLEAEIGLFTTELALFPNRDVLALGGDELVLVDGTDGQILRRETLLVTELALAASAEGSRLVVSSPAGGYIVAQDLEELWAAEAKGVIASDMDGDGVAEIARVEEDHQVIVEGSSVAGWRLSLAPESLSSPVAGDVDGDGFLELVLSGKTGIQAIGVGGLPLANFPVDYAINIEPAAVVLADLDGNGRQEIFVGGGSGVHGFAAGGVELEGFPLLTPGPVRGVPLAADLDGDGKLELAALAADLLYVWEPDQLAAAYQGKEAAWGQYGANGASTFSYGALQTPQSDPALPLMRQAYCYPNPVEEGRAHLRFFLERPARLKLEVFDAVGQQVEKVALSQAPRVPAENEIGWSTKNYASGLYLCRLEARGEDGSNSVVVVKMAVSQ